MLVLLALLGWAVLLALQGQPELMVLQELPAQPALQGLMVRLVRPAQLVPSASQEQPARMGLAEPLVHLVLREPRAL